MDDLLADDSKKPLMASPGPRPRTRLSEFQTQLFERMHVARSDAVPAVRQLGVLTGSRRWLLNLQQAGEITPPGLFMTVPLTQDWFIGLMNIRGNLISVIDLTRFLGMQSSSIDKASRIITVAPGLAVHSGLLVSRVLGLRSSDGMRADEDAADSADAGVAWSGKSYLDPESNRWTELDLSLVTQDLRFLNVKR